MERVNAKHNRLRNMTLDEFESFHAACKDALEAVEAAEAEEIATTARDDCRMAVLQLIKAADAIRACVAILDDFDTDRLTGSTDYEVGLIEQYEGEMTWRVREARKAIEAAYKLRFSVAKYGEAQRSWPPNPKACENALDLLNCLSVRQQIKFDASLFKSPLNDAGGFTFNFQPEQIIVDDEGCWFVESKSSAPVQFEPRIELDWPERLKTLLKEQTNEEILELITLPS